MIVEDFWRNYRFAAEMTHEKMAYFHQKLSEIMMEYFHPLRTYERKIKPIELEELDLENLSVVFD